MIHRDLKPENIRVTPEGVPLILDFGIAMTESGSEDGARLTGDLTSMGTPMYMAPEQTDAAKVILRPIATPLV